MKTKQNSYARRRSRLFLSLLLTGGTIHFTAAQNWLTSGNSGLTSGTDFLGTTDNVSLVFKTNNTENARLTNGGYLGIGLTIPQAKLHVHDSYTIPDTGGDGLAEIKLTNANSGTASTDGLHVSLEATNGYIRNREGELILYGTGLQLGGAMNASHLYINSNGKVGIGNSSPGSKLAVHSSGSSTGTGAFEVNSAAGNYLLYVRDDGAVGIGTVLPASSSKLVIKAKGNTSASSALTIQNSLGATMLFVRDDGNVAIGNTVSPAAKLEVAGSFKSTSALISNLAGTGTRMVVTDGSGNLSAQTIPTSDNMGNHSATQNIRLNNYYLSNDGGSEGITVDNSGNVTTSTNAKVTGLLGVGANYNISYGLYVSGSGYATTSWVSSDARFKKDVQEVNGALDKILKLEGKTYVFNSESYPQFKLDQEMQYGFIAQDLEKVLPELVRKDEQGFYAVNYNGVVPILVEALKEQNARIDELQNKLAQLGNTHSSNTLITSQGSFFSSVGATLSQNTPNPFNETTIINYIVPPTANSAYIAIYDMQGKQLKRFNVEKGSSSITISGGDLYPGIFIYTLIVDSKEIDTKRMILTE